MKRIVSAIFVLLPLISSCSTTPTATPQLGASATPLLTATPVLPTATSIPIATATLLPTTTTTVTPTATPVPITVTISPNLEQAHENGFQLLAGHPPFTVNFSAKVIGGRGKLTYTWDFKGDGTVGSTDLNPQPFTYTQSGEYSATLIVKDESGQKITAQQRIVVIGKPDWPKWKYGINDHQNRSFPLYKNNAEVERAAQMIKDVGIQAVRQVWSWWDIQPNNATTFKWDDYDFLVALSKKYDYQFLAVLAFSADWASTGRNLPNRRDREVSAPIIKDYAWYVYKTVERYRNDIHAWEVWNEPNLSDFWLPQPDPITYTSLLKQAYLAIKYADPSAVVVSAGLSPIGGPPDIAPEVFLQAIYAQGGKAYFDAVGLHPYSNAHLGKPALLKRFTDVRPVMVANGDSNKPIWVTEINSGAGAGVLDEEFQGKWLTQSLDVVSSLDYVSVIIWSEFRNSVSRTEWERNLGLVRYDWTLKPAYKAYKDFIATHP
jgi:hypothetical protein